MARVKIQITTPSNNVIKVSPGVSALSSVQLYLNELIDVNTQHGADGYVLTQQADGTFAMEAVATTLADLSDTNIPSPQGGDSLVYDANTQKWVPGGVKSVNGQVGDVVITIPSPPPTPGVSGLADTNITNLQDDQIIRYDSASGNWLNEDLEALPAGGTTGQALVKASNTDYDVTWDDIAVDVQFHQRYATEAETLRSGATETVELYFFAQGDGNGLAESASSDTPTSGYDIRRKLYYAEQAQADPDTGTWTQFTAIADNTTFNNAKAALLAYLKERTGGTVPISLKMTWEEVSQTAYLLDQSYGSGAEAAYSTRQLRNAATDCMVIRRASDSTTTTIGFDGSGNIDESAITTFCTGTTCTVVTWKDQSGNGNDATAAAPTNEPTIYTGGALVKENGKPAVQFDGSDDSLKYTGNFFGGSAASAFSVSSFDNATRAAREIIYGLQDATGARYDFLLTRQTSSPPAGTTASGIDLYIEGDFEQSLHTITDTNQHLLTAVYSDTVKRDIFDGGSLAHSYSDYNLGTLTDGTNFLIGEDINGGNGIDGNIQEIVIYNSDKSTDRTQIESDIGDYFTQNTPLLDTYSGAAAAYSLRLLDSTYTGALINVWNGTSYADIYPNVFGELDTVALAAHCGSNDGFIRYWYDQSSNSNDATQTTLANMPKIYDGTTGVVTENGKPAVYFDGSNDQISLASYPFTQTDISIFSIVKTAETVAGMNAYNFADATNIFSHTFNRQSSSTWGVAYSIGAAQYRQGDTYNQSQSLFTQTNTGITTRGYRDGAQGTQNNLCFGSFSQSVIGSKYNSSYLNGIVQEIILYDTDKTSDRTGIEDNINTFYSIY